MITRDPWVCDYKVFIDLAAHTEGCPVQNDVSLFVALHQHQRGKHARAGALRSSYGIQDHDFGARFRV